MEASYSIDVLPHLSLVRVTMAGFFTPADMERFRADRLRAQEQLTCKSNDHVTLVDVRGMSIQTQDIVSQFGAILANPATRSRRLAIVVTQSLARMQAQRAAQDRDVAYFADDLARAQAWLLEPEARAA